MNYLTLFFWHFPRREPKDKKEEIIWKEGDVDLFVLEEMAKYFPYVFPKVLPGSVSWLIGSCNNTILETG